MARKLYKSPVVNYFMRKSRKLAAGGVVQGAGSIHQGIQSPALNYQLKDTNTTDSATTSALTSKTNNNMISSVGAGIGEIVNVTAGLTQNTGDLTSEYTGIAGNYAGSQADDFDALASEWSSFSPVDRVSWRDVRGKSAGQDALSVFGASHQGAMAGSSAGPWGCVCAGTRVITNEGKFINIEDLTMDDGIIGWDNGYVRNSIFAFQPPAEKECVEITFSNGEILRCSTDHPILYYGTGRARRIYIEGKRTRVKEYKFVEASSLEPGDTIGVINEVPVWGTESMWNPYLVGLLIGDGSYGYDKSVRLNTIDPDTWKYVEDNKLGHVSGFGGERYSKEFRTYTIESGCIELRNLGIFTQTKENKRLPQDIHKYDKESMAKLLAGLFDSDGYVYFSKEVTKNSHAAFTQSNMALLMQVKEQLLKFGIHSYIKKEPAKQTLYQGHTINSKESYRLVIKDRDSIINMYENIPLNISYKKEHLRCLAEVKKAGRTKDNKVYGVRAVKVRSVTPIGKQYIYNLQADDSHTYIANTIITHNTVIGGIVGLGAGLAGMFTGNRKAKRKADRLNDRIDRANQFAVSNLINKADTLDINQNLDIMANYSAHGGKIRIDPSKRGTFRAQASRMGLSVQEAARKILNAPEGRYSPAMRRKANFARNFGKKHAYGGYLFEPDDFVEFNSGGTHEESSLGGIPQGMDENGIPNLVEQGESKYKDYVFSDRIKVDKEMLENAGLPKGIAGKTFSRAARQLAEEYKERPNDPISKRTMRDSMTKLMTLQEGVRSLEEGNTYAYGGLMDDPPLIPVRRDIPILTSSSWKSIDISKPVEETPPPATTSVTQRRPVTKAAPRRMEWFDPISTVYRQEDRGIERNYPQLAPMQGYASGNAPGNTFTGIQGDEEEGHWSEGLEGLMRYAPLIGSAMGAFRDNGPDYGNIDRMEKALRTVEFNPVGNYLAYTPLDRNYYLNKIQGQAGATRRGVINQSAGNRATALAGLLATDYNTTGAMGQLARQAEEYNLAQRERVEAFNRGTNQFNSEGNMKVDSLNAELGLKAAMAAAQMREAERQGSDAAKSANLTRFFDNLGEIGREATARRMINTNPDNYYSNNRLGTIKYNRKGKNNTFINI